MNGNKVTISIRTNIYTFTFIAYYVLNLNSHESFYEQTLHIDNLTTFFNDFIK